MMGVANNDHRSLLLQATARLGQTLLIAPTKIRFVVANKSIVIVRHSIGRVTVNKVASTGSSQNFLEVPATKVSVLQRLASIMRPDTVLKPTQQ